MGQQGAGRLLVKVQLGSGGAVQMEAPEENRNLWGKSVFPCNEMKF